MSMFYQDPEMVLAAHKSYSQILIRGLYTEWLIEMGI